MADVIPAAFGGTMADDGPHNCDIAFKQKIDVVLLNSTGQPIDIVEFAEAGGSLVWEADPENSVAVKLEDTFNDNNTYYHPEIKGYKVVFNPGLEQVGTNKFKLTATINQPDKPPVSISRVIIFNVGLNQTAASWPDSLEVTYSIHDRLKPLPDPAGA